MTRRAEALALPSKSSYVGRKAPPRLENPKHVGLPDDLWERVCQRVKPGDLERLAQVNRQLRCIARRPACWRAPWEDLRSWDPTVTLPEHMRKAYWRWTAPTRGHLSSHRVLMRHTGSVVAIAAAGDTVITGSWDCTAKIWSRQTGGLLHTLAGHTKGVEAIATAGDTVITGSWDCTAKIWSQQTGKLRHTLAGHTDGVEAIATAGDTVITGSWDCSAKIWSKQTGELLRSLRGHTDGVKAIAAAGDTVITGSRDHSAKIWSQ